MRNLILLLLALGLGVSACSKKSSYAAPPVYDDDGYDDDDDGYNDDYDDPVNGDYYTGPVTIDPSRLGVYQNFIRAGLYNGYYPSNNWNYSYTCNTNFLSWIFQGGSPINCGGGTGGYDNYIYTLSTKPAMIELSFNGNTAEGRWLLNAGYGSNGQVYYEQAISFNGSLSRDSYGAYFIQSGPLALLNTKVNGQPNYGNFNTYFNGTTFGNATVY